MKTIFAARCAALGIAAALSGCAVADRGRASSLLKDLDENFSGCDRHITFQAGLGIVAPGAQVSGSVDCKSSVVEAKRG